MNMYRITCEWDIGHEYLVFTDVDTLWAWVDDNWDEIEMCMTAQEANADGLLGWQELEIVE